MKKLDDQAQTIESNASISDKEDSYEKDDAFTNLLI